MMHGQSPLITALPSEERPVTKMELLDCLAWMDALLEAGWVKGATAAWGDHRPGDPPDRHCLVGAAVVAVREVVPCSYSDYHTLLLHDPSLFGALVKLLLAEVPGRSAAQQLIAETHQLMNYNDARASVEPVRVLVQRAAGRIGSK